MKLAHVGSKGYYVKKIKDHGIRDYDRKRLESFKTYFLINLYDKLIKNKEK
jgi:hypothetical protein